MNITVNPSFTIKKWGKGVFITRTCFHDIKKSRNFRRSTDVTGSSKNGVLSKWLT